MEENEYLFEGIVEKFTKSYPNVILGKMMRSPGLKYKDKVFAFYHKREMGFRLGPDFDPSAFGLKKHKPLSPFKTKPPLKGWYIIEESESDHWESLAQKALEFTSSL